MCGSFRQNDELDASIRASPFDFRRVRNRPFFSKTTRDEAIGVDSFADETGFDRICALLREHFVKLP